MAVNDFMEFPYRMEHQLKFDYLLTNHHQANHLHFVDYHPLGESNKRDSHHQQFHVMNYSL